ncbi:hypothetical protein RIF29_20141 [Crotalaria pallida]|uniref:Uncharacterized protein n=1 Tax=Crotalaria pallida TaxID=3830 RepID=A0AAN9F0L1_CROPI
MPVVYISSDEEHGSEEGASKSDFDWIKELLDMSDDEKSDDSDEVVITHEIKPEPELKSKSSTKPGAKEDDDDDDDDDDDCVVLDGDPAKGVSSADEDSTESDELLVVGQKGPFACRDYPHARHTCAKFPFSSTPHERHCDQCHCYVCDSVAPCLKWGTGILNTDHCHANDTEIWQIQRKNFRLGIPSPLPASINRGISVHAVHSRSNEILPRNIIHLSPNTILRNQASRSTAVNTCSSLNSIHQNHPSRPTTMRAFSPLPNSSMQNQVSSLNNTPLYSTATNLTIPSCANRGRRQDSGSTLVRNRYQPHSVPRQMLGVRGHAIHKERGSGASRSSVGPQLLRSPMMSKGVGRAVDTLTLHHFAHCSSGFSNHNYVNPTQQSVTYHTAAGLSNDKNCTELSNGVWLPQNLPSYSLPSSEPANMSCVGQHTVAFDSQASRESLSLSNDGQNFFQSCIQGSDAAPSSYVACLNSNQHGNEHQIRCQNENSNGDSTQCGIASQDTVQVKPQEASTSETASRDDLLAFDTSWTENTSQSIGPVIESSHLQTSASTNHCGSVEPPIEISDLPSALNDIEKWLLDQDSIPVVPDDLLSELNAPSPELGPIFDTGTPVTQWWCSG